MSTLTVLRFRTPFESAEAEQIARAMAALNTPGCERLKEWVAIGPVQRAAFEQAILALAAAPQPDSPEPDCWAVLTPNGSRLVSPDEASGRKDAYPLYAHPLAATSKEPADSLRDLDTAKRVRFYEHDFYPLSNFSAFTLMWKGYLYDTSEAAYHSEKFAEQDLRVRIMHAPSAHEAFKLAESWKVRRRPDWDAVKVDIMRGILRAKAEQHEYVRRKLLATGDRELVEDSWRDDFWGWGPNRDGQNMLGKLWMELRAELRVADQSASKEQP